ncbi:unnamed protein product [Symbiodinium sp. CCMP2592]|nr:unnamed protein product [Symbiodinium sp. CCMP2592]
MLSPQEEDKGLHRVALISAAPAKAIALPLQKARARTVAALVDTVEDSCDGTATQLLLMAFYGYPGDVTATAEAFEEVLSAALAFGGRFAIWGDFNAVQQEGPFPRAFARGQVQPMDTTIEAEQVCTNPRRTRRIDFGVCHRRIVVDSVSHFDLPHISDHVSVVYQIAMDTSCDSHQAPRPMALQPPDAATVHDLFLKHWDPTAFEALVQEASLDDAWAMLSDVAEKALKGTPLDGDPGMSRSANWDPRPRRATASRAGAHGHESAALRTVRKFSARIHQLCAQQHSEPLRRAVQRSLCQLRHYFENVPYVDLHSPWKAAEWAKQACQDLEAQEKEAKLQRWKLDVKDDERKARSWIKRKARQAIDAEKPAAPVDNLPHAVHPARVVQQQSRAWMHKWTSRPRTQEQERLLTQVLDSVPPGHHHDMTIQLEADDLLRSARSMKGKMEGPDFWSADFLLQMPLLWWQHFAKLWTAVVSTSVVPQAWRKSWVLLLDKKINETRPISISPVAWRIGAKALNRKLLPWLNSFLDHRALGSAPHRSASDVHARLYLAMQQNCSTFVQQDLSSFFDSLDHNAMARAMTRLGAPSCFVNLFKAFYTDSRRLFRVASYFTPSWQTATQGCLQGCPLSPTVALCYGFIWSQYCATSSVECAIYVDDRILWPRQPATESAGRALAEALDKSDLVDKAFGLSCRPEKCALVAPAGDQTLQALWHRKYPRQTALHTLGIVIDVDTRESTLLKLSLKMVLLRLRYIRMLNSPIDLQRRTRDVLQRCGWRVAEDGGAIQRSDDDQNVRTFRFGYDNLSVLKMWLVEQYKLVGIQRCPRIKTSYHRSDPSFARGLNLPAPPPGTRHALAGHRALGRGGPLDVQRAAVASGNSTWHVAKRIQGFTQPQVCPCGLRAPSRAHLTWNCDVLTPVSILGQLPRTRAGERLFAAEVPEFPPAVGGDPWSDAAAALARRLDDVTLSAPENGCGDVLLATDGSSKHQVGSAAVVHGDAHFVATDNNEDQMPFTCELKALRLVSAALLQVTVIAGRRFCVLSDCQGALDALEDPLQCALPLLAAEVSRNLQSARALGHQVDLAWIPSHGKQQSWKPPASWIFSVPVCRALNDQADRAAETAREAHAARCSRVQWWSQWQAAKEWEMAAIKHSAAAAGALDAHYRRALEPADDDQDGVG